MSSVKSKRWYTHHIVYSIAFSKKKRCLLLPIHEHLGRWDMLIYYLMFYVLCKISANSSLPNHPRQSWCLDTAHSSWEKNSLAYCMNVGGPYFCWVDVDIYIYICIYIYMILGKWLYWKYNSNGHESCVLCVCVCVFSVSMNVEIYLIYTHKPILYTYIRLASVHGFQSYIQFQLKICTYNTCHSKW